MQVIRIIGCFFERKLYFCLVKKNMIMYKNKFFLPFWVALCLLTAHTSTLHAVSKADSLSFACAQWNWQKSGRVCIGRTQLNLFGSVQTISIARYPSRRLRTDVIHAPGEEAASTSTLAERFGGKVAINASFFDMKNLTPVTYLKYDGNVVADPAPGGVCNGMLLLNPKGKRIDIQTCTPDNYTKMPEGWEDAIVAGPVLIEEGRSVDFSNELEIYNSMAVRHPRTLVGYDKKGWIYFVVVDGRAKANAAGMNFEELTSICRWLGLYEALNLDGGGSSTLWDAKLGVVNFPTDNRKFDHKGERKVPNIILAR